MSVTVEDKIELFRKMLFGDIESNLSEKKQNLLLDYEKKKQQIKEEMELRQAEIIDDAVKKSEREKQQFLSKFQSEENHKVLIKQQEYLGEIVELLKEKTIGYKKSLEYTDKYLRKSIIHACRDFEEVAEVFFYFTESDIKQFEEFINTTLSTERKGKAFEIKQEDNNILGGFIVGDKDLMMQADYTLKTLIQESRDMIGISISRMFDEVIN